MKALSLGLVKGGCVFVGMSVHLLDNAFSLSGTIDEIDQTVNMTWVQPRVLDPRQVSVVHSYLLVGHLFLTTVRSQVVSVKEKVIEWTQQVRSTIKMVEESAPESLTHP